MQKNLMSAIVVVLFACNAAYSQQTKNSIPAQKENWTVFNRSVTFDNEEIVLDAKSEDGILWINGLEFTNGTITLDIKGKDVQGQSFVGVVFHGADDATFDGIYFRPFNFKSPERKSHAVQYIAMPGNDWSTLRQKFPGKYENEISPVPDPEGWFHAKIVVADSKVTVYVNGSTTPTLAVVKISKRTSGKVGLWVGNGSDGRFKNVAILH